MSTGLSTITPGGEQMQVLMIERKHLIRNPDNRIYIIGDVSRLKEDIKTHGVRQPLEVVDLEDGNYKLIGGERRLTACEELTAEGDTRFDALPCIVLHNSDPDDDKIALITANATARELTDGERLAQYEALKGILTRRKKNGQLAGKVRDELCRILGLSTGAAARLNAISENCDSKVLQQLRDGEISLMGAYHYAQAVIADKTAAIKMPENVKNHPEYFEPSVPIPEHPAKQVESPYKQPYPEPQKPAEPHDRRTMLALAEKTLSQKALWELDHSLWLYKLDFYKQKLPGGVYLWRMNDTQRDAMGLAHGEHTRYAILSVDGDFYTTGWELYNEVVESLIEYFALD